MTEFTIDNKDTITWLKSLLESIPDNELGCVKLIQKPDYAQLLTHLDDHGLENGDESQVATLAQVVLAKLLSSVSSKEAIETSLIATKEILLDGNGNIKCPLPSFAGRMISILRANLYVGSQILCHGGTMDAIAIGLKEEDDVSTSALLKMLSIACNDKTFRDEIVQHANEDFVPLLTSTNIDLQVASSLIVTKLIHGKKAQTSITENDKNVLNVKDDADMNFVSVYRQAIKVSSQPGILDMAYEGLAHISRNPGVKEAIIEDSDFMSITFHQFSLAAEKGRIALLYTILSLYVNLTSYQKPLSEEQEAIAKLYRLANKATENYREDPRESDESIDQRNKKLLDLGIISSLVKLRDFESRNIRLAMSDILLNLVAREKNRGIIAKQGGMKILIKLANIDLDQTESQTSPLQISSSTFGKGPNFFAIEALAKMCVSIDPRILLGSPFNSILSTISPLLMGLSHPSVESNLQYYCLLALTNISSLPPDFMEPIDLVRTRILGIKDPSIESQSASTVSVLENLLFSQYTLHRRASMELICNLITHPIMMQMYAFPIFPGQTLTGDDEARLSRSKNRVKIVLALCDDVDFKTRRAASGALARLLTNIRVLYEDETDEEVKSSPSFLFLSNTILSMQEPDGPRTLMNLLNDDGTSEENDFIPDNAQMELVQRGLECIRHILVLTNMPKAILTQLGLEDIIKMFISRSELSHDLISTCIDILQTIH